MADAFAFDRNAPRKARYDQLDMQCLALLSDADPVANQANFAALIHMAFGWHWVGFYRVVTLWQETQTQSITDHVATRRRTANSTSN